MSVEDPFEDAMANLELSHENEVEKVIVQSKDGTSFEVQKTTLMNHFPIFQHDLDWKPGDPISLNMDDKTLGTLIDLMNNSNESVLNDCTIDQLQQLWYQCFEYGSTNLEHRVVEALLVHIIGGGLSCEELNTILKQALCFKNDRVPKVVYRRWFSLGCDIKTMQAMDSDILAHVIYGGREIIGKQQRDLCEKLNAMQRELDNMRDKLKKSEKLLQKTLIQKIHEEKKLR
jgi:hypothetical protein